LRVDDYFAFGYVPDPDTIYIRAFFKLAPAPSSPDRAAARTLPEPKEYWRLSFSDAPIKEETGGAPS